MKPARLNRKLVLEAPQRVPDGAGGFEQSWVALGTIWGELRAGSGNERNLGATSVSQISHQIVVRAAPFGTPSRPSAAQRFREGSRVFRILAVRETDPSGRYLSCASIEEQIP
ncbi:MAG: head-tail adaptor protein [Mangrovicoccus sp.]|nr:head-tail adaptor protein [Mangrovicoccus sp.]